MYSRHLTPLDIAYTVDLLAILPIMLGVSRLTALFRAATLRVWPPADQPSNAFAPRFWRQLAFACAPLIFGATVVLSSARIAV